MSLIPCQLCAKMYSESAKWYKCNTCGYRVCVFCLNKHKGKYGSGFKCSQCPFGRMK